MQRSDAGDGSGTDLVWYAGYGANMSYARLSYYIGGGRPPGGARDNPGCRDGTPPRDRRAVVLGGDVYFALASPMWGGGLALYDPEADGTAAARAYLVSAGQLSDIVSQEMYREPGAELDLAAARRDGRLRLGDGRYDTVCHLGEHEADGRPVYTFTAHWRRDDVTPTAPSAAYLRAIAAGLHEAFGWGPSEAAAYLADRPGAAGHWSVDAIAVLLNRNADG